MYKFLVLKKARLYWLYSFDIYEWEDDLKHRILKLKKNVDLT